MGNLIKDFWTYQYKGKSYYGVVEVVSGPFSTRKVKRETRIEKALAFAEDSARKNWQRMSHITVQSYNNYLNKTGRELRSESDEVFYPFFVEFEPKLKKDELGFKKAYTEAVTEANRFVNQLIYNYDVEEHDILIVINNSRSIYVFINPVSYGLRPGNNLHKIYKMMFEEISRDLDLKTVDLHQFRFNGLIKTPGSYYAGGYVNPITLSELRSLKCSPNDILEKQTTYTKKQRSLNKQMPALEATRLKELYKRSRLSVLGYGKENQIEPVVNPEVKDASELNGKDAFKVMPMRHKKQCVQLLENSKLEQGYRNYGLISVAISYKEVGYTEVQVTERLKELATKWNYDESEQHISSKVNCVFNHDYKFSCDYMKQHIPGMENLCQSCSCCEKKQWNSFPISREVVVKLAEKKASLRHYKAYLILSRNRGFEKYINPSDYGLDGRTLRELANMLEIERESQNSLVKLSAPISKHTYVFPTAFVDEGTMEQLGETLKRYLLMYTNFVYKATLAYGNAKVSVKRIMELLKYKNRGSAYVLLKKLKDLGMIVFKKGHVVAIYTESFKIIKVDFRRTVTRGESKKWNTGDSRKSEREYKLASGETARITGSSRGSP